VTNSINVNHTPVANFSSTAPQCTGLDVDFTNTGSSGGAWSYLWTFDSGATPASSTLENPAGIVYSTPGTKLVKLLVTNGTCSDSITISININLTPTADFSSNAPQCVGQGVNFTNTGTSGFNWTFTWDLGQDAIPATSVNENPVGVIYSSGGTKTITFTIADQNCNATITKAIFINSLPIADAGDDTTICANRTIQIGSNPISGNSYTWFPPSTLDNPYIANPIAAPIANTTQYIITVVDGATACINRDTIIVTMLNPLIANAGIDVEICAYDSIQIGAALVEGQFYSWFPQTGLSNPFAPNPMASPSETVNYILTVTDTAGCDPITDEILVLVHPLPDANAGIDDTIMSGASTQLIATGGVQYFWFPVEGLSNAFLFNPIASPDSSTDYMVTVTDIFGCKNTDTVSIVVFFFEEPFWVPTAFSPNNDGLNDILFVRGGNYETFEFTVFNRYGEEIFKSRDVENGWDGRNQTTGEKMPSAAYVYRIVVKLINGEIKEGRGIVNLVR
ncbi:MAG: gliding motility-associated C-terminal domain-containing protein, partial [Bacteroidales bacterium]|nr:gliding motility-associated C-terminal domain-containing protein [Bacteroidales bacterium]